MHAKQEKKINKKIKIICTASNYMDVKSTDSIQRRSHEFSALQKLCIIIIFINYFENEFRSFFFPSIAFVFEYHSKCVQNSVIHFCQSFLASLFLFTQFRRRRRKINLNSFDSFFVTDCPLKKHQYATHYIQHQFVSGIHWYTYYINVNCVTFSLNIRCRYTDEHTSLFMQTIICVSANKRTISHVCRI